jgi:hypothetical protein
MGLRARVVAIPVFQTVSVISTYLVVSCVGLHAEKNPVTRMALETLGSFFIPAWLSIHVAVALSIHTAYRFAETKTGPYRYLATRVVDAGCFMLLGLSIFLALNDVVHYVILARWCGVV